MGKVDFRWRDQSDRAVLNPNPNLIQQGAAMDPTTDEFHERFEGAIRMAEVMSIFFTRLGQSLILDMRHAGEEGPLVLLDIMVGSPNDRLLSFRRLRPELPLPERLILAPWPGAVASFDESGILAAIIDRCQMEGGEVLVDQIHELYRELETIERHQLQNMLRGIDTETIWQRKADG